MRISLYILGLVIFISGCTIRNNERETLDQDYAKDSLTGRNELFIDWLSKHDLSLSDFKDSSSSFGYGYLRFTDPLEPSDTAFYWHPSIDSSYFLLTNYDIENGRLNLNIGEDIEYIEDILFKFYDSKTNIVHQGMAFINIDSSDVESKVDIFWADAHTIYILLKPDNTDYYLLDKLNMHIDSIWSYETSIIK